MYHGTPSSHSWTQCLTLGPWHLVSKSGTIISRISCLVDLGRGIAIHTSWNVTRIKSNRFPEPLTVRCFCPSSARFWFDLNIEQWWDWYSSWLYRSSFLKIRVEMIYSSVWAVSSSGLSFYLHTAIQYSTKNNYTICFKYGLKLEKATTLYGQQYVSSHEQQTRSPTSVQLTLQHSQVLRW